MTATTLDSLLKYGYGTLVLLFTALSAHYEWIKEPGVVSIITAVIWAVVLGQVGALFINGWNVSKQLKIEQAEREAKFMAVLTAANARNAADVDELLDKLRQKGM